MAISYVDPFSGAESSTCSIAAAYAAKVQKQAGVRMTEAEWENHQHLGTWGVIKGKIDTGSLPDLPFAEYKTSFGQHLKIGQKDGKLVQHNLTFGKTTDTNLQQIQNVIDWATDSPDIVTDFKWLGQNTPDVPNVPLTSKSVGSMSDEDVSALWVTVKDDIAKSKGINVKGANPALDQQVYEAVGKQIGYSASEVKAKVDAYKATGKKLSALKKKVLKGKPKTATVNAAAPPAPPPALEIPNVTAKPAPTGVTTMKLTNPHPSYGYRVVDSNGDIVGYIRKYESQVPVMGKTNYSVGYTKETKYWVYDANGKKIESIYPPKKASLAKEELDKYLKKTTTVPPPPPTTVTAAKVQDWIAAQKVKEVPVTPTKSIVDKAMDDLKDSLPKYTDEQVAKAYIKAKDQLAADPSNKWTLYTQHNSEFEDAIAHLMSKSYDIHLENAAIRNQITRYLGDGNKLSVLKKKMAKQGEYFPQADTLKKSKNQLLGDVTQTSKTQAKKQIEDMAGIYNPEGYTPHKFSSFQEDEIFDSMKNTIHASMQPQSLYDTMDKALQDYKSLNPNEKPSLLDIVRAYDKKKAAQLGIDNGAFYEKKLIEYSSSPTGQSYIKAKLAAKELEANLPPLPADSSGFNIIDNGSARRMQDSLESWTGAQQSALRTYTGGAYTRMNGALRRGDVIGVDSKNAQKGMRALPQDMLLHRGASFEQFGLRSYEQALQSIGKTVTDEGFFSTSVGGSPAFGGSVKFEVEVPRGTHGAYVQHISQHPGENELILAAGTKFKVLRVEKQGYQTLIRVRAIPGSHKKVL